MSYRAWFQCINPECGAQYQLNSIVYQCGQCQSLLEVQHDTAALGAPGAAFARQGRERRRGRPSLFAHTASIALGRRRLRPARR